MHRRVRVDAETASALNFEPHKRRGHTGAVRMPWPFELEGGARGEAGDYVLRDERGKLGLCRGKDFEETWEPT